MSNLNIIQRRDLDPLILKAEKLIKHYECASGCGAKVIIPHSINTDCVCNRCNQNIPANTIKNCTQLHSEAIAKSRILGGSYIYLCIKGLVFWTSPFYSGDRFAGALLAGGLEKINKNSERIKSLAQLMLLCAEQISGRSFNQKNAISLYKAPDTVMPDEEKNIKNEEANENKNAEVKKDICPMDYERMLLACLRRGDKEEGQKILVNLLKFYYLEIKDKFQPVQRMEAFRMKALELAVLLSRAVFDPKEIMDNTSIEATNRSLKKIEESGNFSDISDVLSAITERMSGMIFSFHGVRHFTALRRAERYIWMHYTRKLSLKEIAKASGLSAPYFSTVFKEEMGENLSNYLNRLRVEKAQAMLVTTDLPICDIAQSCGFEDQSWFSKIFKNNTGLTPGKY
ncbi:MAG: helix-turn-helix domain-containing protein, partial [Treponema sp.]|nr:helix-turn-helix domain-containing protein [Treponema sp.]